MVKIFYEFVFVDDYGITVNLETDIGLIMFFTNYPRRNKYITLRSVCALEIKPGIEIEHLETLDFHVRDIQTFTHQLLMKVGESVLYPKDKVTKRVISEYRSKHGRA
jgi:hypothetical protein